MSVDASVAWLQRGGMLDAVRLRLAPPLAPFVLTQRSRIFQNKTVQQIVSALLRELEIDHRWHLHRPQPVRAYVLQYQESDHHFIHRLLAEAGIWYHSEHAPQSDGLGRDVMVFSDDVVAYPTIEDDVEVRPLSIPPLSPSVERLRPSWAPPPMSPALEFVEDAGSLLQREVMFDVAFRQGVTPARVLLKDYDPGRPLVDLRARARAHGAHWSQLELELQHDEHHGQYEENDVRDAYAQQLLEQLTSEATTLHAKSTCLRIAAGRKFRLDGHPRGSLNREWVVQRVEHQVWVPELFLPDELPPERAVRPYENRVVAVPSDVALRPAPFQHRHQQVCETAVVVCPDDDELMTQDPCSVKVQFPWDRESTHPQFSSCWIRVAQPWAGNMFGAQFLPRAGTEVLVTFQGGDVDRPVITGALYNAIHPTPFALPANATRSGIRTRSTPKADGFNELSFEDAAGREQVFLKAERELRVEVGRDHSVRVQHDEHLDVAGAQRLHVGQSRTVQVAGDAHFGVGGREVRHIASDVVVQCDGERRERVAHHQTVNVGGTATSHVGAEHRDVRDDQVIRVGHDHTMRVGGDHRVAVGSEGHPGTFEVQARGEVELQAGQRITLQAAEEIKLQCGENALILMRDGIMLQTSTGRLSLAGAEAQASLETLIVNASKEIALTVNSSALVMEKARVEVTAPEVGLFGSASRVMVEKVVKVQGPRVELGSGAGATSQAAQEAWLAEQPAERLFQLKLRHADGRPVANEDYELCADGQWYPKGRTGDAGDLEQTIPSATGEVLVRVWDKFNQATLVRVNLYHADTLPEVQQAKVILRNLGLYDGPVDDHLCPNLKRVLVTLQAAHGAPPTGRLDEATSTLIHHLHEGTIRS